MKKMFNCIQDKIESFLKLILIQKFWKMCQFYGGKESKDK